MIHWIVTATLTVLILVIGISVAVEPIDPKPSGENAVRAMLAAIGLGLLCVLAATAWNYSLAHTFDGFYEATKASPPWLLIAGLASSPSFLLTWYWRTNHRDREVSTAHSQERTNLYETAIKLLGSRVEVERLGGVHALAQLGRDSVEFRQAIVDTLSAYVRQASSDRTVASSAIVALGQLPDANRYDIRLTDVDLSGFEIGSFLDLSSAKLNGSNLARARFRYCKLPSNPAHWGQAQLENASFDEESADSLGEAGNPMPFLRLATPKGRVLVVRGEFTYPNWWGPDDIRIESVDQNDDQ